MPELPEVARFKSYLDATSLHKSIRSVFTGDKRLFGTDPGELKKKLTGNSLESAIRHGKLIFSRLQSGEDLVFHFGMTGRFSYYKSGPRPDYTQMDLHFDNDYHLAFICPRKFGKIHLIEDRSKFLEEKGLGPDALNIDKKAFLARLTPKSGMIKPALMDQSTLAGLGNLYVDEILFQEKIHPEKKLDKIEDDQLGKLYNTMQRVLKTVIRNDADPKELPEGYLRPHRSEGEKCPRCGNGLKRIKVGGRSTWICPVCQEN